jgi:hypothetical protein
MIESKLRIIVSQRSKSNMSKNYPNSKLEQESLCIKPK